MDTRQVWRTTFAWALFTTIVVSTTWAQDSNYWSTAYGTRSQLLGGVVTGSVTDISSVFYNPGALALTGSSELLLAGNAYKYQRVAVDNGAGPTRTLISSSFTPVPSLFAGEIPIFDHDRLAYAFLTRRSMDMELARHSTVGVESIVPIASPIFAASEVQLKQDFSEGWYGMTWSHHLSPTLGIGVSPFVVTRSQNTRAALLSEGQDASGQAAVLNMSREFDFLHWGALARFGLSGMRDSLTFGLTVTTPNLSITGSGNTQYNTTLIDQTGTIGNVIGADYREKLDVKYHTPVGAGAGASYGWHTTRIHAAVDWNGAVAQYTVLETPAFTVSTPSGDSTVRILVSDHLHAVLNWGIGVEHRFSTSVSGFASYHTDLSGRHDGEAPGVSVTHWDLNNVAAGATWRVWRSDLALGVSTAFGNQKTPPLPPSPDGGTPSQDLQTNEMLVTVMFGWKIVF